jgi:ribonuclease PH
MEFNFGSEEVVAAREAVQHGVRLDGRQHDELSPIEVSLGTVKQASGSSEIRLGETHVMAGIKVRHFHPFTQPKFVAWCRACGGRNCLDSRYRLKLGAHRNSIQTKGP